MANNILFLLLDILKTYSDEKHPLTRKEIQHHLELHDCTIERHTFSKYINDLIDTGFDIEIIDDINGATPKYYLLEREFEKSEIHLLCNAIYSSHFIPEKNSQKLIQKLLHTQSKYVANAFNHNVYLKNNRKTINKEFFYNIDVLLEAIHDDKAVSFAYMHYDIKKNLVPRRKDKYIIHPYHIIFANDNYYLICRSEHHHDLGHYRIDKMKDINITDIAREKLEKSFDPYLYAKNKIFMYSGNEKRFTLKCDNFILDDMIDKFGHDIYLQTVDDQNFLAVLQGSEQGIIFFALQYLQYCTIVEPCETKEKMKTILKKGISEYSQ